MLAIWHINTENTRRVMSSGGRGQTSGICAIHQLAGDVNLFGKDKSIDFRGFGELFGAIIWFFGLVATEFETPSSIANLCFEFFVSFFA